MVIAPCRFEKTEGADDVGEDEVLGGVDGAVDVAFCGKVEDGVGNVLLQSLAQQASVADVAVDEGVGRGVRQVGERGRVSGVGERVKIDNAVPRGEGKPDEVGADEAAAAGDKEFHGR